MPFYSRAIRHRDLDLLLTRVENLRRRAMRNRQDHVAKLLTNLENDVMMFREKDLKDPFTPGMKR